MTLKLTPDILRAAYDFLVTTEPFDTWNLPAGEDVTFEVMKTHTSYGDHYKRPYKPHRIRISSSNVGHTQTLIVTMAHEMIHLYQVHHKFVDRQHHGVAFQKLALLVCAHHGFDPKPF